MSTHDVPIVKVDSIEVHPNADSLEIIKVFGWQCCVRKGEFKIGDLIAYIAPDYVAPDTPQFAFLGDNKRIKVKKLRGLISQGLIIPAPEGSKEGDDVMEQLGVTRYEPPLPVAFDTDNENGPSGTYPKYDVESYQKYHLTFIPGEEVVGTEKMHGCSSRFVYTNNRLYCGSRVNWKKEDDRSPWWNAAKQNPFIEEFCKAYLQYALYGEVFGQVQSLKYGAKPNQYFFAGFDLMEISTCRWLDYDEVYDIIKKSGINVVWVPEVYRGPFDKDKLLALAELDSVWPRANHYREGIVVKPVKERYAPEVGRVQLKMVSNRYHEKGK